ncbi:hypothetical protein, partial [Escherichia coli]|uniref:hypothetical protein n=1 Tax=Escherichia coli TaxID=562 RepID=UPI001958F2AC
LWGPKKPHPQPVTVSLNTTFVPLIPKYIIFSPYRGGGSAAGAAPRISGRRQPARGFRAG